MNGAAPATPNAVPRMLRGERFNKPPVVFISDFDFAPMSSGYLVCTVCDGSSHTARALLSTRRSDYWNAAIVGCSVHKLMVGGYTTTSAQHGTRPYLSIENFSFVAMNLPPSVTNGRCYQLKALRSVQGGKASRFFSFRAPFLCNEDIAGFHCAKDFMEQTINVEAIQKFSDFLVQHSAMETIHHATTTNGSALGICNSLAPATAMAASSSATTGATTGATTCANTCANTSSTSSTTTSTTAMESNNIHQATTGTSSRVNGSSLPGLPTTQNYYMSALKEFATSQLDRQNTSLLSNAGREDASRATLVAEQHQEALQMALLHAQSTREELKPETLLQWHRVLCGKGLHPEAGQIRNRNVRAGSTSFTPKDQLHTELLSLCQAIRALESRLLFSTHNPANTAVAGAAAGASASACATSMPNGNSPNGRPISEERGLGVATFAAAVFFGVVDTHPFADGNGRIARIATNWALRRGGVPFVVNWFATSTQRAEYVNAIQKTRRNTDLFTQGDVDQEALLAAFRAAGALCPLVELLLDRLSKATAEFAKVVEEKKFVALEEAEARAARRFRERAKTDTCIICFDENPNIATLCCLKPVHLNCIAEWLSSQNSCPQCRTELPSMPKRTTSAQSQAQAQARQEEEDDEDDEDDTTTLNSMEETTTDDMDEENDTNSTHDTDNDDEEEDEDTTVLPNPAGPNAEQYHPLFHSASGDVVANNSSNNMDETTTEETEDDEETDTHSPDVPAPVSRYRSCNNYTCRNRAAMDCDNNLCGRCCVLYGAYSCLRHNR